MTQPETSPAPIGASSFGKEGSQTGEQFGRSKPRKGDRVLHDTGASGTVSSVEGNLCWTKYDASGETQPFIWRFKDGLNALTSWDSKHPDDRLAFCPQATKA